MSLQARADRTLIRAQAGSRRHVVVEIAAPVAPATTKRIPANLALVLDRSGSMTGAKILMAREAVLQAIARLRDEDRFSVVVYDDVLDVIVPSTLATAQARAAAQDAVRAIAARGQTDLCGGWLRGCEQVGLHLLEGAMGRCLLLTDGLANHGITSADEIAGHATALRARGVTTSSFGVGAHFDEALLSRMADAGGGHFYFIEGAAQIPDCLTGEVGEVLATTAREVVLLLEAGEGVAVESLNDFPCRKADGVWRIDLGSLTSGQWIDPMIALAFPGGSEGGQQSVTLRVTDRDRAIREEAIRLTFSYAGDSENEQQPWDRAVQRRAATIDAARAARTALEHNRHRDYVAARRTMRECAERIRSEAAGDPELLALAADLEKKAETYASDMDLWARKLGHASSYRDMKLRTHYAGMAQGFRHALNLVLLSDSYHPDQSLVAAIERLVAADRDLFFGTPIAHPPAKDARQPEVLAPAEEEALVAAALQQWPAPSVRIVFTAHRLADHWFSHWDDKRRTAVVSVADWVGPTGHKAAAASAGQAFAVAAAAFLAYEIVRHGVRALGQGWDPEALMHPDTRGCLFDFCGDRADIEIKLQTADFCPQCQEALRAAGLPLDRLFRMAEAIRELAVPVASAATAPH